MGSGVCYLSLFSLAKNSIMKFPWVHSAYFREGPMSENSWPRKQPEGYFCKLLFHFALFGQFLAFWIFACLF